MTLSVVQLPLEPRQRALLERVHANRSEKTEETVEAMLYKEVFRSLSKQYRQMVSKFENDDGETRQVPLKWGDPSSPRKNVTLRPTDIDWDDQRASQGVIVGEDAVTVRFPRVVLDRLERGLALRQAWSLQYGDAPVKVYDSFEQWGVEQVMEWVQRQVDRIEDEEVEGEEEELYPGLKKKDQPPKTPPRPVPAAARGHLPRVELDQTALRPRKPWDR